MRTPISETLALAVASVCLCCAGFTAGAQSAPLSREKVVELIRKERIIKIEAPLSADIQGNQVDLVTVRSASEKDNDCKIDSMLMAKVLMQAYPGQVVRLKVQFGYNDRDDVDEVTVTAGEVKAYGAGAMSESELLASLELQSMHAIDVSGEKNSDMIKPGPAKETRMLIAGYIEELRGLGTDVKPFEARLKQIEDSIGQADSATIREQVLDLKRRLTDEEALIRDARNIQRESPVQHKPDAQQTPVALGTAGRKSEVRFHRPLLRQVQDLIGQKKQSGLNTLSYEQQVAQVQELRAQKRFSEADSALNSLASQLGIHQ